MLCVKTVFVHEKKQFASFKLYVFLYILERKTDMHFFQYLRAFHVMYIKIYLNILLSLRIKLCKRVLSKVQPSIVQQKNNSPAVESRNILIAYFFLLFGKQFTQSLDFSMSQNLPLYLTFPSSFLDTK